jgi:hypothetical protein
MNAGKHELSWNGLDDNGLPVSSGTYFYVLHGDQLSQTKKMILIR